MKISVVTCSRSEYGILESLIKTGVDVIQLSPDPAQQHFVMSAIKDTWVILFGDRTEMLIAAIEAYKNGCPIAHIHGGDTTVTGYIDDCVRHSIPRFAHLHFPATEKSADFLENMGEEAWRIRLVGSLAFDGCRDIKPSEEPKNIIIYNYCPQDNLADKIIEMISLTEKKPTIWIESNGDYNVDYTIKRAISGLDWIEYSKTMPRKRLLSYLANPETTFIGNSSLMFIEAQYFKTKCIHIGFRNTGREKIEFIPDYKVADRIIDIIIDTEINEKLLKKEIMF